MNVLMRVRTLAPLAVVLISGLTLSQIAGAETDKEIQERTIKQRELFKQGGEMDHSQHSTIEEVGKFRGVYYGYLPCHDVECSGIKMTLSLNAKDNYTLVVQPARFRNRESFEKGKYVWDEANKRVTLTPNRSDAPVRILAIADESTLVHLNSDGRPYPGSEAPYRLERSDQAGNREMHIH